MSAEKRIGKELKIYVFFLNCQVHKVIFCYLWMAKDPNEHYIVNYYRRSMLIGIMILFNII